MFDYLIVGAGFAGSVLAERLANGSGKKVLICDKRPHIGRSGRFLVGPCSLLGWSGTGTGQRCGRGAPVQQIRLSRRVLLTYGGRMTIFITMVLALPFMADALHAHMLRISSRIIGG